MSGYFELIEELFDEYDAARDAQKIVHPISYYHPPLLLLDESSKVVDYVDENGGPIDMIEDWAKHLVYFIITGIGAVIGLPVLSYFNSKFNNIDPLALPYRTGYETGFDPLSTDTPMSGNVVMFNPFQLEVIGGTLGSFDPFIFTSPVSQLANFNPVGV